MDNEIRVKLQENDVTIFNDGSTLIAQRKLARLINVPENTLTSHITRTHKNVNTSKGLDEKTAFSAITYFAYKSKAYTQEARDLLQVLGSGGMRAFNYHEAGYKMQAVTKEPTALELAIADVERAKETVKLLEKAEKQAIQIKQDAIMTNKSNEYYPVSHVRKLNNLDKIKLKELKIMSDELGLPTKQLYGNYEAGRVNTYHREVWLEVYPDVEL